MKGSGQDEIVVGTDLIQATFVKRPVVDQATGLVDDDEGENGPISGVLVSYNVYQ